MTTGFSQFDLHPQLVQAIEECGYSIPTPIQTGIIPLMLKGDDVLGQAQTGTGKTAAFALPILHNLQPRGKVQALVLAPTRELAMQVADSFFTYGKHLGARVLAIYGGASYNRQISQLNRGVDVVVGTPGRLLDLIQRKSLDISHVRTVVLDEADEMLSMGFIEDIETILKETPAERQTALFSATLPKEVRKLAERYMNAPQSVTIQREQPAVAAIEQRYYLVNASDKLAALTRLFEIEPVHSALVFARTRVGTGELANELTRRGFPAETLNGDLSQELRERVLNRFRQNQVKVLVATDVAARGLDIEDISHVVNFDLPEDDEIYLHRIGRTGRAGKNGIAISLITPQEQYRLRRIESYIRQKITRANLPTVEEIQHFRDNQLLEKVTVWLRRGRAQHERDITDELMKAGFEPLDIAAAALKVARAEEKQRPIDSLGVVPEMSAERPRSGKRPAERGGISRGRAEHARGGNYNSNSEKFARGPEKRKRIENFPAGRQTQTGLSTRTSHEAGMVRLSLGLGHKHGVRPNEVVSSIAYYAEIPGSAIGKILIDEQTTLVDIPEEFARQALAKSGDYRIHKLPATLKLA
ncbi:MAG: DEAD/DEAH box helicase [Chloroflexi bacterium]|nr:DEAD/DEAH box helicase [Chloroflexota bacterium]